VVSDAKPKRVQRFGPEVWDQRAGVDWSLWDLWFCVVAVRDHDGDLDALADMFVDAIRKPAFGNGEPSAAKLSHLHDLQTRPCWTHRGGNSNAGTVRALVVVPVGPGAVLRDVPPDGRAGRTAGLPPRSPPQGVPLTDRFRPLERRGRRMTGTVATYVAGSEAR
jgi:hypothetical protein